MRQSLKFHQYIFTSKTRIITHSTSVPHFFYPLFQIPYNSGHIAHSLLRMSNVGTNIHYVVQKIISHNSLCEVGVYYIHSIWDLNGWLSIYDSIVCYQFQKLNWLLLFILLKNQTLPFIDPFLLKRFFILFK